METAENQTVYLVSVSSQTLKHIAPRHITK